MDYENEICPVCGEPFKSGDDIVVCPDCGAPYHRDCWKKTGYCTFRDRHAEDFAWQPTVKKEPEAQKEERVAQSNGSEPARPVFIKNASEEDFENLLLQGVAADKNDEFDGIKVTDAALYLQTGNRRYINKFMRAKRSKIKLTWNWAAFFFAPAWFFYRKLYKAGLIFLSILVALNLFMGKVSQEVSDKYDELSSQISETYNGDNSEEVVAKLSADPEYETLSKDVGKLVLVTFLIPNAVAALLANSLLKKKMKKEIKEAKEYAEDARSEKMELIRRGGVSPFAFLAIFIIEPYLPSVLMNIANWIGNWF